MLGVDSLQGVAEHIVLLLVGQSGRAGIAHYCHLLFHTTRQAAAVVVVVGRSVIRNNLIRVTSMDSFIFILFTVVALHLSLSYFLLKFSLPFSAFSAFLKIY